MAGQKFKAPTPKMGVQRLLRLAKYMRTVPEKRFDMGEWHKKTECGTAMCVAGHATRVVRELRLKEIDGWSGDRTITITNLRVPNAYDGHEAFGEAFALSRHYALEVTHHDSSHRTPSAASRAVRKAAEGLAARSGLKIRRDGSVVRAER